MRALLLYLRKELHHLGRKRITEQEAHDGLVLAVGALGALPLSRRSPWIRGR